jgi:hypothetical protein
MTSWQGIDYLFLLASQGRVKLGKSRHRHLLPLTVLDKPISVSGLALFVLHETRLQHSHDSLSRRKHQLGSYSKSYPAVNESLSRFQLD